MGFVNLDPGTSHAETGLPPALEQGEILTYPQAYSLWGGAVMAQMYLPLPRPWIWHQVTHYPRWVDYFPHITHSQVVEQIDNCHKRLYQAACKVFAIITISVDIELVVTETLARQVVFRMEKAMAVLANLKRS